MEIEEDLKSLAKFSQAISQGKIPQLKYRAVYKDGAFHIVKADTPKELND